MPSDGQADEFLRRKAGKVSTEPRYLLASMKPGAYVGFHVTQFPLLSFFPLSTIFNPCEGDISLFPLHFMDRAKGIDRPFYRSSLFIYHRARSLPGNLDDGI